MLTQSLFFYGKEIANFPSTQLQCIVLTIVLEVPMTRMSKQEKRRNISPRKRGMRPLTESTGPKKDNLPKGYREHPNALIHDYAKHAFIPTIRTVRKDHV